MVATGMQGVIESGANKSSAGLGGMSISGASDDVYGNRQFSGEEHLRFQRGELARCRSCWLYSCSSVPFGVCI